MKKTKKIEKPTKHHRHKMYVASVRGLNPTVVTFQCDCGFSQCQSATPSETRAYKQYDKASHEYSKSLHSIYHNFARKFMLGDMTQIFKVGGYALMCRVEKWAEKFPTVKCIHCDDSVHAGSLMVLIPHETKEEYWGTTVVFIPQCTGEPPTSLFLYPNHHHNLISELINIRRRFKTRKSKGFGHLFKYRQSNIEKVVEKQLKKDS